MMKHLNNHYITSNESFLADRYTACELVVNRFKFAPPKSPM